MMKKCSRCQTHKSLDDFHNTKSSKDGKAWYCKECTLTKVKEYYYSENGNIKKKAANRRFITGFTPEDFNAQLAKQGGVCAICGTDDPGKMDFCADHNHNTGQKRGVLCRKCNSGLGHFQDNPEIIAKAIEYLEHYKVISEGNK
jgi:hypothetical protein